MIVIGLVSAVLLSLVALLGALWIFDFFSLKLEGTKITKTYFLSRVSFLVAAVFSLTFEAVFPAFSIFTGLIIAPLLLLVAYHDILNNNDAKFNTKVISKTKGNKTFVHYEQRIPTIIGNVFISLVILPILAAHFLFLLFPVIPAVAISVVVLLFWFMIWGYIFLMTDNKNPHYEKNIPKRSNNKKTGFIHHRLIENPAIVTWVCALLFIGVLYLYAVVNFGNYGVIANAITDFMCIEFTAILFATLAYSDIKFDDIEQFNTEIQKNIPHAQEVLYLEKQSTA